MSDTFKEFGSWLVNYKGKTKNSTYVTTSQVRSIVRNCLNKEKTYKPKESDLKKITSEIINLYINNMPQKNRSPYKRSWKLLEEFMDSGIATNEYVEENKMVVDIMKKYKMRNPVNWCFTGEVIGGKHIVFNSSFNLRRAIDETDFEKLRNNRREFIGEKIWLHRVK